MQSAYFGIVNYDTEVRDSHPHSVELTVHLCKASVDACKARVNLFMCLLEFTVHILSQRVDFIVCLLELMSNRFGVDVVEILEFGSREASPMIRLSWHWIHCHGLLGFLTILCNKEKVEINWRCESLWLNLAAINCRTLGTYKATLC